MDITTDCINGELKVNDVVLSTDYDEYAYLVGVVTQITKPYEYGHTSGNPTDDVYVDFMGFEYSAQRIKEIEATLPAIYGVEKAFEDYPLDDVIMAPESLIRITDIEQDKLVELLDSSKTAAEYCRQVQNSIEENIDMDNKTALQLEVTARPIEPKGNLVGFASIKLNGLVTVHNFKILEGENGLFVGMPSKADPSSKTGYRNTVYVERDFLDTFNDAVVGAYHIALKDKEAQVDRESAAPKQPIKEQLKAAQKEADRHNAEAATCGRSAVSRAERQ